MVETTFLISTKSLFAIKIVASAKNAQQNRSKDDDDLRVALDGFDFGKYEHHQDGDNLKVIVNGTSLKILMHQHRINTRILLLRRYKRI